MSLQPGVYGHSPWYRAPASVLLAHAQARVADWADWNAGNPWAGCVDPARFLGGTAHRFLALDADGCTPVTRDERVRGLPWSPYGDDWAKPAGVVEFCLACGVTEWLDDGYAREAETANAAAATMGLALGARCWLAWRRSAAVFGEDSAGDGVYTYRGLVDSGRHRFGPVPSGAVLYLLPEEVAAVWPVSAEAEVTGR
jgi:hypothetical protein